MNRERLNRQLWASSSLTMEHYKHSLASMLTRGSPSFNLQRIPVPASGTPPIAGPVLLGRLLIPLLVFSVNCEIH